MAIALTSVTPDAFQAIGGTRIRVFGTFTALLGVDLTVHIGPLGDPTDAKCYSGIPGNGYVVRPLNALEMRAYIPELDPGTYDVFVRRADGADSGTLAAAVTIYKVDFRTSMYDARGLFPPRYRVGPRGIQQEGPV